MTPDPASSMDNWRSIGGHVRDGKISGSWSPGHGRSHSTAPRTATLSNLTAHSRSQSIIAAAGVSLLGRSNSVRSTTSIGTFAPKFIKQEIEHGAIEQAHGLEGGNDFSGKRFVWVHDDTLTFVRAHVSQELGDGMLRVECDDGTQRIVSAESVDKVNPAKFDKADDMAELTHLNEASVVHNIRQRYQADLIYTYSGLFLVAVNPYTPLPIYHRDYVNMYKGSSREDTKPHIFAIADQAFRNLVEEGANQSILVTGESGAGKTENTKKVIQYLAAVATADTSRKAHVEVPCTNLSDQILRANPILEAFGNAQTVRNNNSSRFGKFIRIEFSRSGQIAGAFIDWYLLEKSRVVKSNVKERNYHIFYQLLRGANPAIRRALLLDDLEARDFEYTRKGNEAIVGVSDIDEWRALVEAFHVMNFDNTAQTAVLQTVAAVLHLGNIFFVKESLRADQAALDPGSSPYVQKVCQLLGIDQGDFVNALLRPRVKAGHEWVQKSQTPEQARLSVDALAKGIYERGFADLVNRINHQLDRSAAGAVAEEVSFIGVLDIAGFEIFEENSFEQLCINYTNEKLQQFFNHHMFVLEQEEYAREQIEWKFIDFGKDLQPTIDLIEVSNPIGIFSCLDEDSVMPKASDKSFTEKLHHLWDRKTPKYKRSLLKQGFTLTHYAAEVEYSTEGWLEKNKDPLSDSLTRLLAKSSREHVANLFQDCTDMDDDGSAVTKNRVKKGLFRTVAQRHKEQLSTLMTQLHSTHPHFVRCILPNLKKKPKDFNTGLVLDQLRCNGVLEGIRIARTGFPNRLSFAEFRARYEVLCPKLPRGYLEGQAVCKLMLEKLNLDSSWYRVGLSKVFFRAGVLAELEEQRDTLIRDIIARFQCLARGYVQRRLLHKQQHRAEAARIIHHNLQVYLRMQSNPWWRLFVRMRPLLGATRQSNEIKKKEDEIKRLVEKISLDERARNKVEEERRRVEVEMQRVQQTLESERALALDKEEIFRRLQLRENELMEKLQETIDDQETLEEQLDVIMEAKRVAEEQSKERRIQLEQATLIIERLENEKGDLTKSAAELTKSLSELEDSRSMRSAEEEALQQEVRVLQSQLGLRERKLQDLESRLLKNDQELVVKLSDSSKELSTFKAQVRELTEENRAVRQQMSDLSSTTTHFEDVLRRKDSEMAVLKSENQRFADDRRRFEGEKRSLQSSHDQIQTRLRQSQAEIEAVKAQHAQLDREARDARRALELQVSSTGQVEMLEAQLHDVKGELYQTQTDLSRERQSRDDVKQIADAELENLKREYDALNQSKVTIEKEMYTQSDLTRKAISAREAAELDRREHQKELQELRQSYIMLKEAKIEQDAHLEKSITQKMNEAATAHRKELMTRSQQAEAMEIETSHLKSEVQSLKQLISDSDAFKVHHDQDKQRLEREIVTVRGRLTASENDNRALLNKLQQKNLEIARSNSKASDAQRVKLSQLIAEKSKADEDGKALRLTLGDLQLNVTSLEKQREKLSLDLEDLNHEVECQHKATRAAEQGLSAANLKLAETNRNLESERQLRSQAQQNTRTVQTALDQANKEMQVSREQLTLLQKVFDTDGEAKPSARSPKLSLTRTIDLAQRLEKAESALKVASERATRAESQLDSLRLRHREDMQENDSRYHNSKRNLLEEMNSSQVNARSSPIAARQDWNNSRRKMSGTTPVTPANPKHISKASIDSTRSDKTMDTITYNGRMDLETEVEQLQNQLQMSEMQKRHLQTRLDGMLATSNADDSPSVRRVQKLERENYRLHDMLDDSAKKVSVLEQSIRTGQLSLKEVQTKSHEELYDLLNSQEQNRRSILAAQSSTVTELAEAKISFDELKQLKNVMDVDLRDARSELAEVKLQREQEASNHSQLLQEFSELQIRLDTEASRLADSSASLSLYKARADEYFEKLEQAEIAVMKATRAEQFARSQAKEAEETCAIIISERKAMDSSMEDLQRQVQQYEERSEDLSTDLETALQARKRLQNELDDYRSQRATDLESKELSMEQTRKKYQSELKALSNELELERNSVVHTRNEQHRLKEELEELRNKWDDEVLNSSTWAKEKSRLEIAMQSLSNSRDEAMSAHNDAQSRVVELLSQVRSLRTNVDDSTTEKDLLVREKKGLETRLAEMSARLDDLSNNGPTGQRNAASFDRELLELKDRLAQQEDIASAAVGKMRRSESLVQEVQKDIANARETSSQLHHEKANLEKIVKDLQLKCVDLETKSYSRGSQDVRFLNGRVQELEHQLEHLEQTRTTEARSVRNVDRTVKDLQSQLERREKSAQMVQDDLNKSRDKIDRLLQTIDELQASDSGAQLSAKRAERELREEREKSLRLEREVEGLRLATREGGSMRRLGTPSIYSEAGGSYVLGINDLKPAIPERKSSLTKGFL